MKKLLVFVIIMSMSPAAFAWGDREQGILTGIGAMIIYDQIAKDKGYPVSRGGYGGYGGYGHTGYPSFRCYGTEIQCAYERGVYERERREYEEAKRRAYECGRHGINCD
jgi:hypothetical protein